MYKMNHYVLRLVVTVSVSIVTCSWRVHASSTLEATNVARITAHCERAARTLRKISLARKKLQLYFRKTKWYSAAVPVVILLQFSN